MFYKKKSLGQNFLKDKNILRKIVDAGDIKTGETALEIGPGNGDLTKELLSRGAQVVAVEKDNRLIPILQQKFSAEISIGKLVLIHSDILDFNPETHKLTNLQTPKERVLPTGQAYKLVANIPYYITGEILRKALSEWPQPKKMVLLVQKEVAERIIASKKESLLSISVKIYGTPKIIGIVKAGSFSPAPKVDSAIIAIQNISKNNFETISQQNFFEIVKAGFAHKRKKLSGNLKPLFREKTEEKFIVCKISEDARAENLTPENWLCLATN